MMNQVFAWLARLGQALRPQKLIQDYRSYEPSFMKGQAWALFGVQAANVVYSLTACLTWPNQFLPGVQHAWIEYGTLFLVSSVLMALTANGLFSKSFFSNQQQWLRYFDGITLFSGLMYITWALAALHFSIVEGRIANFMSLLIVCCLSTVVVNYTPPAAFVVLIYWLMGITWVLNADWKYDPKLDNIGNVIIFNAVLIVLYIVKYSSGIRAFRDRELARHTIEGYNSRLEREVREQTEHINTINNKLIMAMADMMESRDMNTGGHIKRTSETVRILTDEMRRDPQYAGMDDFFRRLVKAAPMHDLGKIAVDDAILRKPGRFTPGEYTLMQVHPEKGAEIVNRILADYDDEQFRQIAVNVAHYHHERVDGSGYPTGIKGDSIPLEARIMAIADVYDALVSERCYKQPFSFEEANRIILSSMGTHFDARLRPYFEAGRPRLEAFYAGALKEAAAKKER